MNTEKDLDRTLSDVVLDRELEFTIGKRPSGVCLALAKLLRVRPRMPRTYRLYPLTLAKMLMLRPHTETLRLDQVILQRNPYVEGLRVATDRRETCCHILAVHTTPNTRAALHDSDAISCRRELFMEKIGTSDLATLILHALSADHTEGLMSHLGLDHERERLAQVMEIKRKTGKNNLNFGGISLLGAFIGQLKEMGYTDDEILYERSYSYLRLMLADKITSVYVTDEELAQIPSDLGGTFLRGDDPDAADGLLALLAERGVTSCSRKNPREQ